MGLLKHKNTVCGRMFNKPVKNITSFFITSYAVREQSLSMAHTGAEDIFYKIL